ncbi:hypothetical protein K1T71_010637 [Dendrolimus kikuchii]|uniref:Uncharacterized protein n=1 Tax=Dendrolimus kikuchii TaxID=765133 RepID=A0ACC1CPP1_9NEOP|nr:hypothetical protein K1T71_010637 [Dendrolimus kikuchii]
MLRLIAFCLLFTTIVTEKSPRVVELDGIGAVSGEKYWNGDFYEFYGVPYAKVPKGRDKFKPPLPVEPWEGIRPAVKRDVVCYQVFLTDDDNDETLLHGEEDCLTMNFLVPEIANDENLVPVLVYIHSGAFSGGSSNMGRFHYLARHDVLTVSFNYRLGAWGFACLGTEEIPGNAALKDQLAALQFINKHIRKFGGDPKRVTLAGFSVGAALAELLALSKKTDGLIEKLILESGSALSPFTINRDPISTAKNIAISIGFNATGNLKDLTEFLLEAPALQLADKSKNFFLTNSTFGFSPCIESKTNNPDPFLTDSPLDIMNKDDYKKIPVLTGFSNMEGISRTIKFGEWQDEMNEDFSKFLPADLKFDKKENRENVIKEIKKAYFKDEEVSFNTLQEYIDYFSDSMFKYAIMKSARLHALKSDRPVFFYEFVYVGKLNMKHMYMDKIKGASHRDQSAYILDFFEHTTKYKDMDTRTRMTTMWTDFVKYENPTAYESLLIDQKWLKYTMEEQNYMEIGLNLKMKKDLFAKRYQFWDRIYDKYHWIPMPVNSNMKYK